MILMSVCHQCHKKTLIFITKNIHGHLKKNILSSLIETVILILDLLATGLGVMITMATITAPAVLLKSFLLG